MAYATAQDTTTLLGNNKVENPSLLLDKFLLPAGFQNTPEEKDYSLHRVCDTNASFLEAKRKANTLSILTSGTYDKRAGVLYAVLKSRLAVNLAEGLLENAGICLDRNTGSPYLPASGIKGCCCHAAYWMEKEGLLKTGSYDRIFGTTEKQGIVSFLPAFTTDPASLIVEILTPHPRHNGQEGNPVPNKYPVIESGARFVFNYFLSSRLSESEVTDIHDKVTRIFERAFEAGFGAKTAAGLGWFQRDLEYEKEIFESNRIARESEEKRIAEEAQRKADEIARQQEIEEQERKRAEAAERKRFEEQQAKEAYDNASPLEKLRIDWSMLSKDAFGNELLRIGQKTREEQLVLFDIFIGKNAKNQKKYLKDKRIGPVIKAAAKELQINLP